MRLSQPYNTRSQKLLLSIEEVAEEEIVGVVDIGVEEEIIEDRQIQMVKPLRTFRPRTSKVNPDTRVQSIQTFQQESGLDVLYIINGGEMLIFVQNLLHALGRTSSLQSLPNEDPTSPARL